MNPDGSLNFAGVNFVLAPLVNVNLRTSLAFQNALVENGVEFTSGQFDEKPQPTITVSRTPPNHLVTKMAMVGQPNLGQLIVISEAGGQSLDSFIEEAETIAKAFDKIWSPQNRNVIGRDVTLRYLHESEATDAFSEIWESMLGNKLERLSVFGPKVHGGGLRLVIAPVDTDPEPHEIQFKIESFLTDSQKAFIETVFRWPQPMPANARLDARSLLKRVDNFVVEKVIPFVTGAQK